MTDFIFQKNLQRRIGEKKKPDLEIVVRKGSVQLQLRSPVIRSSSFLDRYYKFADKIYNDKYNK